MLVLSEKKPTAGSSQIKNTDTSRIDLSTVDYDKRLLSFFTWQPFVRDCRDIFIIFLCESTVFIRQWNRIRTPIDKKTSRHVVRYTVIRYI
jgi:hypothetical protein